MNEVCKKLVEIIEEVLDGRMGLKEYYRLLPEEADDGTIYEDISNDIETVIEHQPNDYGVHNKNKYIQRKKDYKILFLDLELLKKGIDIELLLKIRNDIIKQGIKIERLTEQISETINNHNIE